MTTRRTLMDNELFAVRCGVSMYYAGSFKWTTKLSQAMTWRYFADANNMAGRLDLNGVRGKVVIVEICEVKT